MNKSAASSRPLILPACAPQLRYKVSLCMVATIGLILVFVQSMSSSFWVLAAPLSVFIALFSFQWCLLYSSALTRHRRAFFDESNILDTYQTRARTHGHLFTPDPPTPAPKASEGSFKISKSEFEKMRDAHYNNMFKDIERRQKEKLMRTNEPREEDDEQSVVIEFSEPMEEEEDSDNPKSL